MFIAFDGIDGCGKNTQVDMLRDALISEGRMVRVLDFGGETGFKNIISDINQKKISVPSYIRELIYYFEGLYTNMNIIQKYKNEEDIIIDRYYLSYYAYGLENGFTYDQIAHYTTNLIEPDVYFYLDCRVESTYQRIRKKREFDVPEMGFSNSLADVQNSDAKEKKFFEFQNSVKKNYLTLLKKSHIYIDAEQPKEKIHRRVLYEIQKNR